MRNFLVTVIFSISGICYGTEYPADAELNKCLAKNENYTTTAMTQCVVIATKEWDRELNTTYQALMKKLDEHQKEELKAAQLAWIKYRDLEVKSIVSIYEKIPGTMYQTTRADRIMNITKARTIDLKNYLRDLQETS